MKRQLSLLTHCFIMLVSTTFVKAEDKTNYMDASAYAAQTFQASSWYDAQALLNEAFDDVCMDTFCEGDYSNLTPLRWRCSVEKNTGELAACVWIFAGSAEFIDRATGTIEVTSRAFPCEIPVKGTMEALLGDLFAHRDAPLPASLLHRPLAGIVGTLYGSLARCM